MGYASVVTSDEYSLFNSIGALAGVDRPSAFFAHEVSTALPGAGRTAAGLILPTRPGVFGLGLFRFGDDVYSEQIAKVAFSNKLGIASLGMSIQYVQYQAEGYPTQGAVTADFGGRAQLTSQISVGAHITNFSQSGFSEDELLPMTLTAGIGFKAGDRFYAVMEAEKDLAYPVVVKTGAEYTIHGKFLVRSGFNINPNKAFFGLGVKTSRLLADYALQFDPLLGESHQASAIIRLGKPKKK
jgi:hypothetical protein